MAVSISSEELDLMEPLQGNVSIQALDRLAEEGFVSKSIYRQILPLLLGANG